MSNADLKRSNLSCGGADFKIERTKSDMHKTIVGPLQTTIISSDNDIQNS